MIVHYLLINNDLLNLIEKHFKFGIYPINNRYKNKCVSKW